MEGRVHTERTRVSPAEAATIAGGSWDVVIIGSGAGGGTVAWRLAERGHRVLVLEKGPALEKRHVIPDEVGSCRRDRFVPSVGDDPHVLQEGSNGKAHKSYAGWTSVCVGGGTVHMSAMLYRMHPEDFDSKTRYGVQPKSTLIDWPIRYEHLKPYYDEVSDRLQLSGATDGNPYAPPSAPYVQKPINVHKMASEIDRAGWALGYQPYPTPRGILSASTSNRAACVDCGYCGAYACPVGAKASVADTFLPLAEATTRCQVVPGAQAVEIVIGDDGSAEGVVVLDAKGQRHLVPSKRVILAASAVESARLLLLSRPKGHAAGLGNGHGQVGQNLVLSLDAPGRATYPFPSNLFPDLVDGPTFLNRSFQDRYLDTGAPGPYPKSGTLILDRAHRNPIQQVLRAIRRTSGPLPVGADLVDLMQRTLLDERSIAYECFVEMLPRAGANVQLDTRITDANGLPSARISVDDYPHEVERAARLRSMAHEVLNGLQIKPLRVEDDGEMTRTYFLQAGTCRMGEDPKTSVTNAAGQVHDVPGLYVTDGGALPTMGGVPPTLTIMANALRIADGMKR